MNREGTSGRTERYRIAAFTVLGTLASYMYTVVCMANKTAGLPHDM